MSKKASRGDLSGPVLAILVTLLLLAIGAVILAYFTIFTGSTAAPVLALRDQPVAYQSENDVDDAVVEVTVANIGTSRVVLSGANTRLSVLTPFTASTTLGGSDTPIEPGQSVRLTFTFDNEWDSFSPYRSATGLLYLVDSNGSTVAVFEVTIRIIGGGG